MRWPRLRCLSRTPCSSSRRVHSPARPPARAVGIVQTHTARHAAQYLPRVRATSQYPVELGVLPPVFGDGRFVGIRNRKYGRTVIAIYVRSPSGRLDLTPYSEEFVSLK